jgi:PilZ domain/Gram-negative bacterial TonB protein C-terminal
MSTSTEYVAGLNTPPERRFYPRVTPLTPIYVGFGPNNLGTLLNVSENGLHVATPAPLDVNSAYRVCLSLNGAPSAITVSVRTIWTDKSNNSSGIQLLDLSEESREQIRNWVALQTSRIENSDEGLEEWFTPKRAQTLPDIVEEALDAAPEAAESPRKPESPQKIEFPPMPLPIHGEFTYEPPPQVLRKKRRVRRRSGSRSSAATAILWTLVILMICSAAAWAYQPKLFEQNVSKIISEVLRQPAIDRFLHRSAQVAEESPAVQPNPSEVTPGAVPPDTSAPKASGLSKALPSGDVAFDRGTGPGRSSTGIEPNASSRHSGANTPNTLGASANPSPKATPSPSVPGGKNHNAPAPKPNLNTLQRQATDAEAPEVPRSRAEDSGPDTVAKNDAISAAGTMPTPPPPAASRPSTAQSAANAPASTNPSAKASSADKNTSAESDARKSAIYRSILNPGRPSDVSNGKQPANAPASPTASSLTPGSSSASTARPNSNATPNSNPGNPPVIQMDVPRPRTVEVTPPRSLTATLTASASYVDLPGERVIHSPAFTIHIERSVKIPRERIPGERWLFRGRKKVVVGELASRVDPQIQQASLPYGSITVEATIDKDGYVSDVQPLYGSYGLLPNVFRAIRDWRYTPTYVDNKRVETQAKIEIDFRPVSARVNSPNRSEK